VPERGNWAEIKDKRMGEPGAREAYNAARIATSSAARSGNGPRNPFKINCQQIAEEMRLYR
jgi:hypothetical protein